MEYGRFICIKSCSFKRNFHASIRLNFIAICIIQFNIRRKNIGSFLILWIQFFISSIHHHFQCFGIINGHCLNIAAFRQNTVSCRQSNRYTVRTYYFRCQLNAGIHSMQLIQSRSIDLTCAAPADTNQVTVVRLRRALDLILSSYRILCRSCGLGNSCLGNLCGLFHRSRLLCRLGLFGSGCRIAFLRQVALVHQSFIALLGSRGLRLVGSLLAARYLRRGCHIIIARRCH